MHVFIATKIHCQGAKEISYATLDTVVTFLRITLGGRARILIETLRNEMRRKSSPYRRSLMNSRR
jgi:hypothetical protein